MRYLIEQLNLIIERKDHLIKKLSGLSDDEKEKVVEFFRKKPNLENRINWNKKGLTFDDFKKVMATTKAERKRNVKKSGIAGLKKNKDYVQLKSPEGAMAAYIPLNWEASKLIASRRIGGVEGEWCTAYQKDVEYWNSYVHFKELIPIYFVGDKKKYAMMIDRSGSFDSLWNEKDESLGRDKMDKVGVADHQFRYFIKSNKTEILNAKRYFKKNEVLSWIKRGINDGSIKIENADYSYDEEGEVVWKSGTWKSGVWQSGVWKGGIWQDGVWKDGVWLDGVWKGGKWENGTWKFGKWWNGIWENGTWETGLWHGGTWENGVWKDGIWVDGIWKNGVWEDGEWWSGVWKNGFWADGLWKNGEWESGVFKNGTWKDGIWRHGDFRGGVWVKGKWHGGNWYGVGTWEGGEWLDDRRVKPKVSK